MTRDEALAKLATRWWEGRSPMEIARWQLNEPRLCMDFGDFQAGVEKALGRSVWTHEFAQPQNLIDELDGKREPLDPFDSLAQMIAPERIIGIDIGPTEPK